MSSNDNKCLIIDANNQTIDLSHYLTNNGFNQLSDFDQHFTKGLTFNQFFDQLVQNVTNDSDKYNVWCDVLLDIIDNNVISESMLSEVMNITIRKCKSDSIPNRVFSCKMLSKLSQRFNESIFVDKMLPLVQYLCRDCQSPVRAHISKQLLLLSQNFSFQTIKTQILPQLMELIKDKELMVRNACIESLVESIPVLNDELNKQIVLPLIVMVFDNALFTNDRSLGLIFVNFGKLCQTLPKNVISSEKWFLQYYCNVFLIANDFQFIAKNENFKERDIHCRNLLALYFPILLTIYGPNDCLLSVLNFLCSDLDITVVRTIASVFNQINIHLKNAFKLYPQLSKLLNTRNVIVIKELMPFLAELVIDAIKSTPLQNKNDLLDDVIKNLIVCENMVCLSLDWRLHIKFLENLTLIMPFLPFNAIKTVFIPLLLNRILTSRPIPVRIASSGCAIALFRDRPELSVDLNIYEWFVTNLSFGNSSQRMLFLNVCQLIDELLSDKQIIISYFLEPLLSLRRDKVPNIRLNVCKKFKSFKHLLQIPDICDKIQKIKVMFREMLSIERDRDVIDCINQLVNEFEWKSDFERLEIEELTEEFVCLTIDGLENSCESVSEVNNNSMVTKDPNSGKSDSIKHKSCLPQLIRSQNNTNSYPKCLPTNHINESLIPSKIPKAITKSSK